MFCKGGKLPELLSFVPSLLNPLQPLRTNQALVDPLIKITFWLVAFL
jgi:hypothetical protein